MKRVWLPICAHPGTFHDSHLHYSFLTSLEQKGLKEDLLTEGDFKIKKGHFDNIV